MVVVTRKALIAVIPLNDHVARFNRGNLATISRLPIETDNGADFQLSGLFGRHVALPFTC